LECQRVLKMNDDELTTLASKRGYRMLARSLSRYEPRFNWPKPNTLVELQHSGLAEKLAAETCRLLPDLKELASIEIEILNGTEMGKPAIKLAGGAGIDKEAVRLCLNELLPKGPDYWAKAASTFIKHRELLDKKAISLGRQAAENLQIQPFHTEILKLIGYLNWRTSYRQNQYLHSFEVAQLAGIVAIELGEDPAIAKRCGILHDIGKALDYKIEGSHAVISGDYADRYGERKLICDTVMSHHNDLVVESPLAYILKTADTLSGARPGARVNLEEGYQTRLSAIDEVVNSFPGVVRISIMNGAREVHVEVNNKKTKAEHLEELSKAIARKIESEVAFPGQIKVLVTRKFEAVAVA
ncbi:MAG: HDIG domain-containing metalloprotein, partial [Verrucomicrobiota bacterium]